MADDKDRDSSPKKPEKPAVDETESKGPPPSPTRDNFSHRSSPEDDVQEAMPPDPPASTPTTVRPTTIRPSAPVSGAARVGSRPVTGTVRRPELPQHVVKHPK